MISVRRVWAIIAAAALLWPAAVDAACGTRGGPGYRGPDGKCVGWANFRKVCGSSPSTNCTPEMVAEGAGAPTGTAPPVAAAVGAAAAVGFLPATTAAPAVGSMPIQGQASVVDGDTLEIHGQRIRLSGIDAPESDQLCRDAESNHYRCGQKAANDLAAFIDRRPVVCIEVDRDRYRRAVAVCTVGGVDLADWLVRGGLALDWPQYSRGDYAAAQKDAERAGKGMWAGSFVRPWDYRPCIKGRGQIEWCSDEAAPR